MKKMNLLLSRGSTNNDGYFTFENQIQKYFLKTQFSLLSKGDISAKYRK